MKRYRGPLKLSAYQQTGKGKGDAVRLGFAQGDRRHPDDPRRRSDDAARGAAELLRRHRERPGRLRAGHAAGLPDGAGGDALLQQAGEHGVLAAVHVPLAAADQGHAVRHEGAVAARLRADRGGAVVLRRLRSVRRLRPDLRRRPPEPEDRRDSGALPRAHLRHDQHRPLEARLCCCCGCRRSPPARSSSCERGGRRPRPSMPARRRERAADALAGAVRTAPARVGAEPAAPRALRASCTARVARELPPRGARAVGRAGIGARVRARHSSPTWS